MQPRKLTYALPAGVANGISLSQTPSGAGALTITGSLASAGVADLTSTNCSQRRVLITCAGADSARTFVVTGTRAADTTSASPVVISESMAGSGGSTTQSLQDFATVTSVTVDAATAGAVTVGTSAVGSSPWQRPFLDNPSPFAIGFGCIVSGTVNYDVQHTFDRLPGASPAASAIPNTFNNSSVAAKTASSDGNYAFPINGFRLNMNSGTGSVIFEWIQAGIIGN